MRGLRRALLAVGFLALAGSAGAQDTSTIAVTPHRPANLPQWLAIQSPTPGQVPGTLRLPGGTGRVAAVVVLHGSGGVDGRGEMYGRALQAAGIAALEIDMWRARGIGVGQGVDRRPRTADTLPDVFGAVRALAAHPRIDPRRIGVMGMSYGGGLSMLAATEGVGRAYGTGGADIRAAAPLYPPCWAYDEGGPLVRLAGPSFPRLPMLLLAGAEDDYDADAGGSCRKLGAGRARMEVHVYPGTTHAWDTRGAGGNYRDPAANRGRGGAVRMQRNATTTEDGTRRVVAFFTRTLAPR
jgi:dienelactone hydrolase